MSDQWLYDTIDAICDPIEAHETAQFDARLQARRNALVSAALDIKNTLAGRGLTDAEVRSAMRTVIQCVRADVIPSGWRDLADATG